MIHAREYRVVPWKNGGGTTREIAASSAENPAWRISLATIERDGPFSDFTGYDRTIVAVEGSGCELAFDDEESVELERLRPFAFAGERLVTAWLSQGAVVDFNVITLRSEFAHRVAIASPGDVLDDRNAVASFRYIVEGPGAGDTLLHEPLPAGSLAIAVAIFPKD